VRQCNEAGSCQADHTIWTEVWQMGWCSHEHNTVLVHYKSKHIEWAGLKLITLYVQRGAFQPQGVATSTLCNDRLFLPREQIVSFSDA
jgi:hypothetical protein